jgi:hypothetical protein
MSYGRSIFAGYIELTMLQLLRVIQWCAGCSHVEGRDLS